MAFDKVVDSAQLNSWLTDIGDSVRRKTGKQEKIPIQNIAAEIDGISGGGENLLKYATTISFQYAVFPLNSSFTFSIDGLRPSGDILYLGSSFYKSKNLKKLSLVYNGQYKLDFRSFCKQCFELEEIDITGIKNASIVRADGAFSFINNLRNVIGEIDLSSSINNEGMFSNTSKLTEIRFKEQSINKSISFDLSNALSDASIQSIINGLAIVTDAQTLRLAARIREKLTPEQQQAITAKNWTVA